MGLPLMTVRLAALFSRFLGATATHLHAVFQELRRRPGVYLFDEFDAIGQARADAQDIGEMRRLVTAFLQFIDADRSPSMLVAATTTPSSWIAPSFAGSTWCLASASPRRRRSRSF